MSTDVSIARPITLNIEQTRSVFLSAMTVVVLGTLLVDPVRVILLLIPVSFLLAAHAAGRLLEPIAGPYSADMTPHVTVLPAAVRIGIGTALIGLVTTLTGLCGWYWITGMIVALLAVWAVLDLFRRNALRRFQPTPVSVASGLILGILWLITWLWATIPPVFYDELAYHLPIAQYALRTGMLPALPWSFFTFMPHVSDLLLGWGLALAGDLGVRAMHVTFWIGTYLAAWGIVEATSRPSCLEWRTVALTSALASSTTFLFLGTLPFAETLLAMSVLLGVAVLVAAARPSFPWFALGLLWGLAATVKLSGLSWVVAQGVAAILLGWPYKDLICAGTVAAASAFPWWCRAWWHTDNPLYPMAYRWLGGRYWSEESQLRLRGDLPSIDEHAGPLDILRIPYDMIVAPERFGSASDAGPLAVLSVCLVLLLPAVTRWVGVEQRRRIYAATTFMVVAAAGWIATSTTTRFFAPALILGLVTVVVMMSHLPSSARNGGLLALGLLGLWGTSNFLTQHALVLGSVQVALGQESPSAYLSRSLDHYDAADYVRKHLASDARILFIGETRPYYFDRLSLAPYPFHDHPLARWVGESESSQQLTERILAEGFTHVVLNMREFKRLHDSYGSLAFTGSDKSAMDGRLKELPRNLTTLFAKNNVFVFEIPPRHISRSTN